MLYWQFIRIEYRIYPRIASLPKRWEEAGTRRRGCYTCYGDLEHHLCRLNRQNASKLSNNYLAVVLVQLSSEFLFSASFELPDALGEAYQHGSRTFSLFCFLENEYALRISMGSVCDSPGPRAFGPWAGQAGFRGQACDTITVILSSRRRKARCMTYRQ